MRFYRATQSVFVSLIETDANVGQLTSEKSACPVEIDWQALQQFGKTLAVSATVGPSKMRPEAGGIPPPTVIDEGVTLSYGR